jgi:hypothetical protein
MLVVAARGRQSSGHISRSTCEEWPSGKVTYLLYIIYTDDLAFISTKLEDVTV